MLQTWACVSLDPFDTEHRVGTVLRRHKLKLDGQAADFRADLAYLGDEQMSVTRLSYGAPVTVEPVPEPGFWVLSLPLCGHVSVDADTGNVDSRPGVASLIPSSGLVKGHWHCDTRQAVLRIKEELLWQACDGVTDNPEKFLRQSSPTLLIESSGLLQGMMQTLEALDFNQYAALPERGRAAQWAALARLLAGAVVCSRLTSAPGGTAHVDRGGYTSRIQRAHNAMQDMAGAEEFLNVSTLADKLGISIRTLQTLFQSHAGTTVLEAIREVKLLRANHLLAKDRYSVADAALACGFQHQGRFAAHYAKRFGQLPGSKQALSKT